MGKEQRQPSAADLILVEVQRAEKDLLRKRTKESCREREEQRKEREHLALMEQKKRQAKLAFGEIDKEIGLTACLEEINRKVLNGEGKVEVNPVDIEWFAGVRLEWQSQVIESHRMTILYYGEDEIVITAGGSFIDGKPSFGLHSWRPADEQINGWPEYTKSIPFSTPDFRDKFNQAIGDAYKSSRYMNTIIPSYPVGPDFVAP